MEDLEKKPDNFLTWAILTTILCCLPTGIVAIVYANKVDTLWLADRKSEAADAARNARTWTFVSLGLGITSVFIGGIITFLSCFDW